MHRRTLLKILGGLFAWLPFGARGVFARVAQASPPAAFTSAQIGTLTAIAETVLPSTLTAEDRRLAVRAFTAWFANYKPGSDMGHGYGSSSLRQASGPSPISRYPPQFDALDAAATARGSANFAALAVTARREVVEAFLNAPQPVNRLAAQPSGANLVADFMGVYFNSQDGWNLCYRAEINRDTCRTLDNSEQAPKGIRG